jgi:UDP-N-acetylmuramate--alanine ligase
VTNQADRAQARTLLSLALRRPASPFTDPPARVLVVDFDRQQLYLAEDGEAVSSYPVSTAAELGGREGSNRTPPGWHRVHRKIGAGAPLGAVFESREPTGRVWTGGNEAADLILTRILTLEGLEEGVNRGAGVDSLERYIYIHGTNHPGQLGEPVSHGCVRMDGEDIVELFERVEPGDPVVIVSGANAIA